MAKRKTAVPFQGTAEQEKKLREIIEKYKSVPGAVMPVLQQAQEVYGYLPIEVQKIIAEGLDVPLSEIYGVTTFYSQFSLNPKGKYEIRICLGTACYVKGSGNIMQKMEEELGIQDGGITDDGKFSLDSVRCIGACGLAPAMVVNGEVYGRMTADKIHDIIASCE